MFTDIGSHRFALIVGISALVLSGCGAVYPEFNTPLRNPPNLQNIDPPAPNNMRWVAIKSAQIPDRTRDGRRWHELGSPAPDPYAVLFVNGKELIRTDPQASTLEPTWPNSPRGNFRFRRNDKFRIEVWENGLTSRPICVKDLGTEADDWVAYGMIDVACDGGARVTISFEQAHPRFGYGFYYEFRTESIYVTRVFEESPAARAGLLIGDQIVTLGEQPVSSMKSGEIRGFFNASKMEGIKLEVIHPNKERATLQIKESAIYPQYSEMGNLP